MCVSVCVHLFLPYVHIDKCVHTPLPLFLSVGMRVCLSVCVPAYVCACVCVCQACELLQAERDRVERLAQIVCEQRSQLDSCPEATKEPLQEQLARVSTHTHTQMSRHHVHYVTCIRGFAWDNFHQLSPQTNLLFAAHPHFLKRGCLHFFPLCLTLSVDAAKVSQEFLFLC